MRTFRVPGLPPAIDNVKESPSPGKDWKLTPDQFVARAQRWVSEGVQVVGGCCGIELEYIRPLRDVLPERVPG